MSGWMQLWQLPVAESRNRGLLSLQLSASMLLLMLSLSAMLMLTQSINNRATVTVLALPSAALVLYGWYVFVSSMANACSPTNLKLLPHLARHVAIAACAMWFALSLLLASFFANPYVFCFVVWLLAAAMMQPARQIRIAAFAVATLWVIYAIPTIVLNFTNHVPDLRLQIVESLKTLVMACAVGGGLLALTGLIRVFTWFALALWAIWISSMFLSKPLLGVTFTELLYLIYSMSSQFATHVGIALGLLALTIYGLLGFKGDALIKRQQNAALVRSLNESKVNPAARLQWQWGSLFFYNYFLQRKLNDRSNTRPAKRLLPFTFGPGAHWSNLLWSTQIWAGMLIIGPFFIPLVSSRLNKTEMLASWMLMLPIFFVSLRKAIGHAIYQSRLEQGLLSLTPGWLPDAKLKRGLAGLVFGLSTACLAISVAILLIAAWLHGLAFSSYLQPLLSLLICTIFLFGASLRSYSTHRAPVFVDDIVTLAIGLGPLLLLQIAKILNYPLAEIALLAIIAGVAFSIWRWQKMMNGPIVLPVAALTKP